MIYIIISAVCCVGIIWGSFKVDVGHNSTALSRLINMLLLLAAVLGVNTILICLGFWAPKQFVTFIGKFYLVLIAWYSVTVCMYLLEYPDFDNQKAFNIVKWVLFIAAVAFVYIVPNCVGRLSISQEEGFVITSENLFWGRMRYFIPINVFQLYVIIYFILLPFICTMVIYIRSENEMSKIISQRMGLIGTGVFAFYISAFLLYLAKTVQPRVTLLLPVTFAIEAIFFIYASKINSMGGWKSIFRAILRFVVRFALPGILLGFLFAELWPMIEEKPVTFLLIYAAIVVVIITIWYQGRKYLSRFNILRDDKYGKIFEDQLASIDYEGDTNEITKKLYEIFRSNCSTSSLQVLIDNGEGELESIYSSNGLKLKYAFSNPAFDVLLNLNRNVVFRDYAEHNYNVASVRMELKEILDAADSDVMILLNEGRRILGAIMLGKKLTKNIYDDYDYETFTKLYSYFFVVGYYMKNIVNESVVGTVNREIKMSGQIITSIQENMDQIKNPKVDAGYIMVPAHNIGGEFIDFIRLNDTRHIFVIGAMSGKGIAASMNMVILKSVIRTFLAETTDFKLLVEKINSFIRNSLPKGSYFAGMFGLIDFATDTLYYINCGSPALFLYSRAYNNIIEIQGEGRVLGFAKDISSLVKVKKVKLAEGDMVAACTDGLIETRSLRGELFGKDRVGHSITENATYPANKMAQFTYDALVQFSSKELEDDITVLVLKYKGGK